MTKKSQLWDVGNEAEPKWDVNSNVPCFKLWKTDGKMTALVDSDLIPYVVGYLHKEDDWAKALVRADERGLKPDSKKFFKFLSRDKYCKKVINHCDAVLNTWVRKAKADSARIYISVGMLNFRFDVAMSREYKGTRKQDKPPFYSLIKWHLITKHKAIQAIYNEADDLLAIDQYMHNEEMVIEGAQQGSSASKQFSGTIIVTKDKDLRMIPGWHSNPDVNKGEPFWVDVIGELEPLYYPEGHKLEGKLKKVGGFGLKFFYAQLIMGDAVDNYLGLPSYGMNAALEELNGINKAKKLHKKVETLYKRKYGEKPFKFTTWTKKQVTVDWKDMLVEQGRLAWMMTHPEDVWQPKHVLPSPKKWQVKDENYIRRKKQALIRVGSNYETV